MAVSLYHQGDNIDRSVVAALTDQSPPDPTTARARPSLHDWVLGWMTSTAPPKDRLDSLPGVMWHFVDAWGRREESNVTLVHYQDLKSDLAGEMRRLAARLDLAVPEAVWSDLVNAATFTAMKGRAMDLAPDPGGHRVLKDRTAFFRRGNSGEGNQVLTSSEMADYLARVATLAPDDLLAWLHRP
jgi:hypothetical protein